MYENIKMLFNNVHVYNKQSKYNYWKYKKTSIIKIYLSLIKLIHELAIIMPLINYKNVIARKLYIVFLIILINIKFWIYWWNVLKHWIIFIVTVPL